MTAHAVGVSGLRFPRYGTETSSSQDRKRPRRAIPCSGRPPPRSGGTPRGRGTRHRFRRKVVRRFVRAARLQARVHRVRVGPPERRRDCGRRNRAGAWRTACPPAPPAPCPTADGSRGPALDGDQFSRRVLALDDQDQMVVDESGRHAMAGPLRPEAHRRPHAVRLAPAVHRRPETGAQHLLLIAVEKDVIRQRRGVAFHAAACRARCSSSGRSAPCGSPGTAGPVCTRGCRAIPNRCCKRGRRTPRLHGTRRSIDCRGRAGE